jgi:hypothetical protein
MLVCNVAMRPARTGAAAIAADVIEAAAATDDPGTGNVVFATLVDDPASVGDLVDAYLGEIMLEAASAVDAVSAGAAFTDAIDETVTAADTQDATISGAAMPRHAMILDAFINSDGTARDANANGTMINL